HRPLPPLDTSAQSGLKCRHLCWELTMRQPRASRPHMHGYGILDADSGKGLLPWTWATERLAKARNYWVSTSRPDGNPHLMPVWGIWLDDAFCFSTGTKSRKA